MLTNHPEIPLDLCQVLEEEFENLHEPLDDGQDKKSAATGDGGAPVVKQDWKFYEGHVDEPFDGILNAAFAAQSHQNFDSLDEEKQKRVLRETNDLYVYLALKYFAKPKESRPGYVDFLNDILLKEPSDPAESVFKKERFERLTLREETKALVELGWKDDEIAFTNNTNTDAAKGDLTRFRRLLLEDAFPEALKRIYDLRLNRIIRRIHNLPTKRSALCLSGGGIRSGTFALGVIQSLANRSLLDQFDYLSTVSGGGYIGGWLTAWIHRHPDGLEGVIAALKGRTRTSKLEPEPEPLRHLRDYSSFITPRTGVLSADTWAFVTIYIRNLLLNWVVLVPLLASILMIPRVSNTVVLARPSWTLLALLLALGSIGILMLRPALLKLRARQALPLVGGFLLLLAIIFISLYFEKMGALFPYAPPSLWTAPTALLVAGTLLGGYTMAYMRLNRPSNSGTLRPESFWMKHQDQNSFIWLCLLPLCTSAVFLTTFWAWYRRLSHNADPSYAYFFSWRVSEILGFLIYGFLLGLTGWLLYMILSGSVKGWKRELVVTLAASVIGALILYAIAVNVPWFYSPVVEPFSPSPFKGGGSSELLSYSKWWGAEIYTCLAFPTYLLTFFLGITLFVGFTSRETESLPAKPGSRKPAGGSTTTWRDITIFDRMFVNDEDREWLARACAWLFIAAAGWLFFSGLVIFGPLLIFPLGKWLAGIGGVSGLVSILGARSADTPGNSKKEGGSGWLETLGINVLVVAAFVFFACIVILVSLLTGAFIAWLAKHLPTLLTGDTSSILGNSWLFTGKDPFSCAENVLRITHFPAWYYLLGLALIVQGLGRGASYIINLNNFSLHAGYRDRIVRAFLGASRLKNERHENPFTGFDPRDNLFMEELRPWLLRESDFIEPGGLKKFVDELVKPKHERSKAAQYLRDKIRDIGGDSNSYFKDLPGSIERNPSFRSALFADLDYILQDKALREDEAFTEFIEEARSDYDELKLPPGRGGNYRVISNRLLLRRAFPDSIKHPPKLYRLLHVVNMALNLVGGKRLAWQQRRAESFTSSPLHSGSFFVGYRRTRNYGGKRGLPLGTAIATSGAAASSNMGYFSPSPFVTLILTFFNARLGWWLGNPGVHGADTYFRSHPKKALSPILDEAFGLTDDENPYVLLSDGGHFENLGLYEMVLRRCRHIFVVDGSADPEGSYDDLGGAVRKIRIDFGIRIEFKKAFQILSRPGSLEKKGAYCAVGDIYYEDVDGDLGGETGKLIYIKPAVYGDESRDIFNYTKSHETFPHESTADQFFDEPQFESHRMLGFYILEKLFGDARQTVSSLDEFVKGLNVMGKNEELEAKSEDDEEEQSPGRC